MTTETDTLYSALGEAETHAKELEAEIARLKSAIQQAIDASGIEDMSAILCAALDGQAAQTTG